jgi:hypothetical protein
MAAAPANDMTLVGYAQSVNTGNVLTNFNALADPHIRVEGVNIIVPELNNIAWAFACGASITEARISSPSILRVFEHTISPLNVGAEPLSPTPFADMSENPIPLVVSEALRARMRGSETAAEYKVMLLLLTRGPIAPVKAPYRTIRATSSTTLTPYAWTNGSLSFDQTLPAGNYQVIGMRAQSAGLIAARLVFPGYPWRPGVIGFDSISDVEPLRFRFGNMGVFGTFRHDAPPTVDFLSSSADTSEEVWLDLVGPL